MHRQLIGEVQTGLRGLDRIDVADHVRDRDVGRCELLDVAGLARPPGDRHPVALARDAGAACAADGVKWIVVDFAAGHDGDLIVEQTDQAAQDPALRLAAQAQQNEIVPRQDRVDELRHDRVVVADDAGEEPLASLQLANEVVADFLFDRSRRAAALPQLAEGLY